MRYLQPDSFPKLLVIGFALVALPLIFALVNNAISIDRFANRSQVAVQQAVQSTQSSRRLAELLAALERNARQIAIVGGRSLLGTYEINREQFQRTVAEFSALPLAVEQKPVLDAIVSGEAEIYATLRDAPSGSVQIRRAVELFPILAARMGGIIDRGDRMIDREIEAMRETAAQARLITIWQMLALVPVALLLAGGFIVLIARPIRQIDAAIQRMGSGDFTAQVGVSGPRDLQLLGRRIEWLRHRLNELERQKNRFLRQVSHELKTPLTALREGSELLSEQTLGRLTPEQQEVAGILRSNSIELQRLIEDLLAYGAAGFHRSEMRFGPVAMRRVVARVLDDQNLALRARALRIAPHIGDITVEADFEKLRVIVDNLVSNAAKFAPERSIIALEARSDNGQLVLEVADAGAGIPPAERERVFDPFYRGRNVAAGRLHGSGVGLSIVRDFAQAHGGSVEVVDDPARPGARLRVTLPLQQDGSK